MPLFSDPLLVSETLFSTSELEGLSEPVEVCAIDVRDTSGRNLWGRHWKDYLEPTLPAVAALPEDEGFLLRPLPAARNLSWQADANRRVQVPPREAHGAGAGAVAGAGATHIITPRTN